jgi:hypothetical protein
MTTATIPADLIDRLETAQPVLRAMIANWRRCPVNVRQIERQLAAAATRSSRGMTPAEFMSMAAVVSGEVYRTCEDKIAEYDTLPEFVKSARTQAEAEAFAHLWRSGQVDSNGNLRTH